MKTEEPRFYDIQSSIQEEEELKMDSNKGRKKRQH